MSLAMVSFTDHRGAMTAEAWATRNALAIPA
jgi:hypothetical protein